MQCNVKARVLISVFKLHWNDGHMLMLRARQPLPHRHGSIRPCGSAIEMKIPRSSKLKKKKEKDIRIAPGTPQRPKRVVNR